MTIHNAKWVFLQSNELNALFNIMWISSSNGKNLMEYTIYYMLKFLITILFN